MRYIFRNLHMQFTDQLNNTIELKSFPNRIISLVPSQSELLWDLGLREELVGITKFCIHPQEMFKSIERVGGTKTLNIEKIRALQPDLIIGNKEENEQSQILELQKEFTVWMSDIYTLEDSLSMIEKVGALVNRVEAAKTITNNIQHSFLNLRQLNKNGLYFIWREPFMAAGKATFIGDILKRIGFENKLSNEQARYPELNLDEIKLLNPELIFLSSEPYPFKANHIKELQDILPHSKIVLVDGELFSWYGSRLQKSVAYFNELIKIL
ncbi:MAG: ABC transporter substrate-binding protein [Bacteroidetes bacterium]|nr:ABC transporter substrate-binding protein [Bacteroidota bacterium]